MLTPNEQHSITDGPSALDLVIALAKCHDKRNPFRVQMMVQENGSIIGLEHEIAISGLDHEDGSGHEWLFKGHIVDQSLVRVKGYFDSATRKGWIRVVA